jgi:molybdate transport system ATP-binding protein
MLEVRMLKQATPCELNAEFSLPSGLSILTGAPGSKKSLLLKCLAGLELPDAGTITHLGKHLWCSKRNISLPLAKRSIGIAGKDFFPFPHMSVIKNIEFALHKQSVQTKGLLLATILQTLELTNIQNHLPHQLYHGQKIRVALARTLAALPSIVLLDEPFAQMEPNLSSNIMSNLQDFFKQHCTTVLLATNNLDVAWKLSDSIMVMDRGRIVQSGTRQDIAQRPACEAVARFTGCENIFPVSRTLHNASNLIHPVFFERTMVHAINPGFNIPPECNAGIRANDVIPAHISNLDRNRFTTTLLSIEPGISDVLCKLKWNSTILSMRCPTQYLSKKLHIGDPFEVILPPEKVFLMNF